MYYSGYLEHLGCGQTQSDNPSLTGFQCDVIYSTRISWLIVGFLGCFIHLYVAFCYLYMQYSVRSPIEAIILNLSLFDLFCCVGLFACGLLQLLPMSYNWHLNCIVFSIFRPFYQYGLLLMILMLAANRYYAVCRPVMYDLLFSEQKIKKYSITILAITVIISLIKLTKDCELEDKLSRLIFHKYIDISFYCLFMIPISIFVIVLYFRIQIKFRRRLAEDERISFFNGGALDQDITEDRTYLRALSCSLAVNCILLLFDLVVTTALYWPDFDMFTDIQNEEALIVFNTFEISATFLFVINPFIFFTTSKEFRAKLARPIRYFRGAVDKNAQLPVARLNTEPNPMDWRRT